MRASVFFLLFLLASLASFARAQTPATPQKATVVADDGQTFVRALGDTASSIMRDDALSRDEKRAGLRRLYDVYFDKRVIARTMLAAPLAAGVPGLPRRGPEELSEREWRLIEDAVGDYIVSVLYDKLHAFAASPFDVWGVEKTEGLDLWVVSYVTHPKTKDTFTIKWRLRKRGTSWGIVEVNLHGILLAQHQKRMFSSLLGNGEFVALVRLVGNVPQALLKVLTDLTKGTRAWFKD